MAGTQITTPYARLAFVELEKPKAFKAGDKEKYSVTLLFPYADNEGDDRGDGKPYSPFKAGSHDLTGMKKAIAAEATGRFKKATGLKLALRDGEAGKWSDGYTFLRTSSLYVPQYFNRDRTVVTPAEAGSLFYGGAWVRAVVELYTFEHTGNRGVSAGLRGLQFVCHDSPLALSQIDATRSFDEIPDADVAGSVDELEDLLK